MFNFLYNCFTFKGIFENRNSRLRYNVFWFIVLVFVTSFPLNFQIISNNGWSELNTVTLNWKQLTPSWTNNLPGDMFISSNGLETSLQETYVYTNTYENKTYTLVFNPNSNNVVDGKIYLHDGYKLVGSDEVIKYTNCVVLDDDLTYYYKADGKSITGNYKTIKGQVSSNQLNSLTQAEAATILFSTIDSCFNSFMIFSNIFINTLTQFALNLIMIFLISAIFILIRIKYEKVVNYTQALRIFISSMTIPGLISFVVGITGLAELTSFTVVLFQLITPLLALGAIYKGSKIKDPSIKYVA